MLVELRQLVVTFIACFLVGTGFAKLGFPAPYMLGSLFGMWFIAGIFSSTRAHFGIPRWFHITIVLGLSTLIGATFTPEIIPQILMWSTTVLAMLIATIVAVGCAFLYLKSRGYSSALALMCTIPGGQAEIAAISHTIVDKDYVVMFTHLVRVATVVCMIPLLLAVTQGSEAIEASHVVAEQLPHMIDLPLVVIFQFIAIALVGFIIAKKINLPIAHLLGPLILSSALHATGIVSIPRTIEYVIFAQITIGAAVGVRLAKVRLKKLSSYFFDALVNTFIIISIYCLAAILVAHFKGIDILTMIMAFVPGGIYEVTILALIFGFDIAIIMFHHTIRILLIFTALPFVVKFLQK